MSGEFLPVSRQDLRRRGWRQLDVILVSGDAYVDHPSFGIALIGRFLESLGYRVGVIAQPDWRGTADFMRLGRPRLFFGVSSGNVDSMVANYTANKRPRRSDDYSPGGKSGLRPDRALIVYANRVREAFAGVPIVLGGLEASLRRLAHYDYWDNAVRRSILIDARGDILVYGMGESQVAEIASRLAAGGQEAGLDGIRGTVVVRGRIDSLGDCLPLPSYEEVNRDQDKFLEAFRIAYQQSDPVGASAVAQPHGGRFLVQHPPALPLSAEQLDRLYELPYARESHPCYQGQGGIKALETVRASLVSHRGCSGECSFCGLRVHQGRIIQSRSEESILREARALARRPDFRGTITDVGGPTANLYGAFCPLWAKGGCAKRRCLLPKQCGNLSLGYGRSLRLYRRLGEIPGVKHVFISSGFRYDLLLSPQAQEYLLEVCRSHISGQMKVAPEHVDDKVLELMNKPPFRTYQAFLARFRKLNSRLEPKSYLVNYFISAHPGACLEEAELLAGYLAREHIHPEQVQDFLPLPMTLAGCMYYTERHPFSLEQVYVAKTFRERKLQRALIQPRHPRSETHG